MGEVSATLVKELREKTGAGIMECKNALVDNGGDIESAMDWLRNRKLAVVSDTLEKLEKGGPSISFTSHAKSNKRLR
jgi:elongation factor Ts